MPTHSHFLSQLCGESAGANLALGVALILRDEKAKKGNSDSDSDSDSEAEAEPQLRLNGVLAMYPPLDAFMGSFSQVSYPAFGLARYVTLPNLRRDKLAVTWRCTSATDT